MSVSDLVNRLKDPSLTWNIALSFGGKYIRKQAVSTSNPQILHICDDIICFPIRFSEYFYWHDGNGNLVSRIFPNHQEAWDHVNETNPNTSAPYNGATDIFIGYAGYWGYIDLTDGSTKARVYIGKRNYPELQILIFNTGTITIRVNDPPTGFGLSRYTTGTPGTGYVDLGQNQYVVYYKTTTPDIDATNKVFAQSPLGSSKRYSSELYIRYKGTLDLGFNLYTGIKSKTDMLLDMSLIPIINGAGIVRGSINTGGYRFSDPKFDVYADDPYATTWRGGYELLHVITGWAEDENGNVKFIIISAQPRKTNTKVEEQSNQYIGLLYDCGLDEWLNIRTVIPIINQYSYGSGGAVQCPFTKDTLYMDSPGAKVFDAVIVRVVTPTDTVEEYTTAPGGSAWTYVDAYALMNCYDVTNECRAVTALGIYTDDTGVSIPTDVRQAFGVARWYNEVVTEGIRVKPFQDRTLLAGKTYAVITRAKIFPRTATATDFLNWAKKKYPVKLTDTEWSELLSVLPLTKNLAGGKPVEGTYTLTAPTTATPGSTITVTGSTPRTNANVKVVLIDPDTYTVIASNTGTTDASGNYSVSLTIPSTATPGKTYKIYVVVG